MTEFGGDGALFAADEIEEVEELDGGCDEGSAFDEARSDRRADIARSVMLPRLDHGLRRAEPG